jgi:hypothetical protein
MVYGEWGMVIIRQLSQSGERRQIDKALRPLKIYSTGAKKKATIMKMKWLLHEKILTFAL